MCSQTLGGAHEDDYVAMLLEHSVAGIVFVSGVHALVDSDPARYQRLLDLGLPFVLVALGADAVRQRLAWFTRHEMAVSLVTGGLLMVVGFLMITNLFVRLNQYFTQFPV